MAVVESGPTWLATGSRRQAPQERVPQQQREIASESGTRTAAGAAGVGSAGAGSAEAAATAAAVSESSAHADT
ncbi:hypothetical protein MNEG_10877, partial [Monoraphidium neglectum]